MKVGRESGHEEARVRWTAHSRAGQDTATHVPGATRLAWRKSTLSMDALNVSLSHAVAGSTLSMTRMSVARPLLTRKCTMFRPMKPTPPRIRNDMTAGGAGRVCCGGSVGRAGGRGSQAVSLCQVQKETHGKGEIVYCMTVY